MLFLYRQGFMAQILRSLICRLPFISMCYGLWQRLPLTKRKIKPFIKTFQIDADEFEKKVTDFTSFQDFFIRRLKPSARPIAHSDAIIPADGRYRFFQNISPDQTIDAKGHTFSLPTLLNSKFLAEQYLHGTLIIGRLAPSDAHRFFFPCDGVPCKTTHIPGPLFSVHPKAEHPFIFENKRALCLFYTQAFGTILMIEIGATNVGSIHQTYTPNTRVQKGEEKGFFNLGASMIALLFPKNSLTLESDLYTSSPSCELRCLMGEPLGNG